MTDCADCGHPSQVHSQASNGGIPTFCLTYPWECSCNGFLPGDTGGNDE
jgi:hypothetical protein